MKFLIRSSFLVVLFLVSGCDTLNQTARQVLSQAGNPTSTEIALGLKQALEIGTGKSTDRLSTRDAFLGNLAIKILFPPEAQKVENTLRSVGLGKLADDAITSINHAAEDAAREAKPIFVAAIKQMTITDAVNILLGNQNDAATQYFKRVTTAELVNAFNPVIKNSLDKVGATKYWSTAMTSYNRIPLVSKINPDLDAYVTQKAIDGLFLEIAKEELNIRSNFSARSTSLLQKVFGYADRNKG